jgi:dynein heavy chain
MDELLDVLANGNNPTLLFQEKNYMNKIVQAGDKLKMDGGEGSNATIHSMNAFVGIETVTFDPPLKISGKVENYIKDILDKVLGTLKESAKISNSEYISVERIAWITKTYAQLNLLTNNIYWVKDTEESLEKLQKGQLDALKNLLQQIIDKLTQLIVLVQGKLDSAVRKKTMCLITIDTHCRDIIEQLINENVRKADEFQWASQLKFYWDTKKQDA